MLEWRNKQLIIIPLINACACACACVFVLLHWLFSFYSHCVYYSMLPF